jgi:predicted RecB family nuclease
MGVRISKSKFCAGVQCLKRLYLLGHSRELAAQPSASDQAIIEQGRAVGMLARQLFPGGVEVCERSLDHAIRKTRELVANSEVPAVFEAAFEHDGVLVCVDVLHRRKDGRWRLIEVKSSTDVKEQHLHDVGIQYRVVSRSGLDVGSASLAHVNRNYVFDGQNINLRRFFRIRNLTRRVQRLEPKLTFQLRSEFAVLRMPNAPEIAPGRHCTDPVTCEFFDHCNPARLKDHISYLPRLHASAIEKLEGMGVESIRDIPDDFELSDIQRRACTSVQNGEPWFDRGGLKAALAGLKYPIFFMDFETVNPAIPRFAGMRPYDHLPFQWSVHVVQRLGAEPEHRDFLATEAGDPRRKFIASLCEVLRDRGSIVVFNAPFESQRLSDLAAWLPDFAVRIERIQSRLWDLLLVVRNHVYHPAFAGSYSLKTVLPALVPEMTYSGLEVANGRDAGLAWESVVRGALEHTERERIRKALLSYCRQDTIALVRLVEKVQLL